MNQPAILTKQDEFDRYLQPIIKTQARPVRGVSDYRGQKMFQTSDAGLFKLTDVDTACISLEILCSGAFGRIVLFDDEREDPDNVIFKQMTAFTGSFPLNDACAFGGLYLWINCGPGPDAIVTVTYREYKQKP